MPEPISTASGGAEPQGPALLSGHQLVGKAVAHEVALRTRLPPSPSEKTTVGPRRPPTAHEQRRGEEPGSEGRRDCRKEEDVDKEEEGSPAQPEPSPSRTKWRPWRRANCEAGPRPFPLCPHPRAGLAGQGEPARCSRRGRGGEGSSPAHYAKRPAPPLPPRGKGKRVGFSRRHGASMSARQARPLRRRPDPAPTLFQFYLRIWRQSGLEAGPVSAAGGPRRGGQGAGRPGSRRWRMAGAPGPQARWAAGERQDAEVEAGAGPGAPPGSWGRGGLLLFLSVKGQSS